MAKATFQTREHCIPADLARLKEARDFAAQAAADFGLDEEACYQVKLAMSEAVTNAIQHGSTAPDDEVAIAAVPEADGLAFEVRDTGRFIPRVTRGDEMAESGRGLDFMRLLMDDVQVHPSDDGTLLRFVKRAS